MNSAASLARTQRRGRRFDHRIGRRGPPVARVRRRRRRRRSPRPRTTRRPPAGSVWPPSPAGRGRRRMRPGRRRRGWAVVLGGPDERRHVAGHRLDVGLQLGVVAPVGDGVVADDVDDRAVGPPGVVEVGQTVAQSGAEVEQRGGRACRPCGRSRRRPRWPRPSNRASTPCIRGTSSRAATKCISEVPGFMKQVSTPCSTSVRMRALGAVHERAPSDGTVGQR